MNRGAEVQGKKKKQSPVPASRGGTDQVQMDELAYSSRMLNWPPLGKLMFTLGLLFLGLITNSIVVPLITFCIGLALMAYSTNLRLPPIIAIAILEAILIMIIGSGMISIMGNANEEAIYSGKILWMDIHITEHSFNKAWLIFFRAVAGVTLMLSFASSTPIPHLAQACKRLHLPKEIIEIVVLIYRYAFLLLERMLVMLRAAQCRLGYNGPIKAMRSYAGAMAGTFIFSMELAEKSEAALACRNYQGHFPVFRMPAKVTWPWFAVTIATVVVLYFVGTYTEDLINMADVFGPICGW